MKALLVVAIAWMPAVAFAEQDMCPRGKVHRGAPVDLDVKDADVGDVFRLLAGVGRVNVVLAGDVGGKATLKLKRIPWDQAMCTLAASHRLEVVIDGNVVTVRRPAKP